MPDLTYAASARGRSVGWTGGVFWLVGGGVATALSLVMLVPMSMQNLSPVGIPGTAVVVVGTLYLGMIIVRSATPPGRLRTALLALDLLAIIFVTALTAALVFERAVA